MGFGSRLPTSNDPPENPNPNPWGIHHEIDDDFAALLGRRAVRCCHCQCVVSKKYVTIVEKHAFCPDHKGCKCKTDNPNHYFNVSQFVEHNKLA